MHTYTIRGVQVHFPFPAYGCQKALMEKVIRSAKEGQHALLESPTGTGKSLSLLCSALAWQRWELNRQKEQAAAAAAAAAAKMQQKVEPPRAVKTEPPLAPQKQEPKKEIEIIDLEEDDFQPAKLRRTIEPSVNPTGSSMSPEDADPTPVLPSTAPARAVRIYYATRTHSQIAQVISELRRTVYRPQMVVLGSRRRMCIDPSVLSASSSVNEACQDKLDTTGCSYKINSRKLTTNPKLYPGGSLDVWDIEDIAGEGSRLEACPYFASRDMLERADLVFCPYDYLVQRGIRESMQIDLENSVIVLDEAHNIEEVSREAASLSLAVAELEDQISRLETQILTLKDENLVEASRSLSTLFRSLVNWTVSQEKDFTGPTDDRGAQSVIVEGDDLLQELRMLHAGENHIEFYRKQIGHLRTALEEDKKARQDSWRVTDKKRKKKPLKIDAGVLTFADSLLNTLDYIFADNCVDARSFEMAVTRERATRNKFKTTFHLWCLRPSVAFRAVQTKARAVMLTSGTLSPTDSFASELGMEFKIKAELGHVIDLGKQLWSGVISSSANEVSLNASFRTASTFDFQDAIGDTVEDLCRTIPCGVLLFFPSYRLMDNLLRRWESTGTYQRILNQKPGGVYVEPSARGGSFDEVLAGYRDGVPQGALLMAVCRGKVSEGIDFKDDQARGVLIVGIPYANVRDIVVMRKRRFNDANAPKLLSGSRWYSLQAFRAVNQAIGRVIRHRHDYGAIVLLDCRYSGPELARSLPKWVRPRLQFSCSVPQASDELQDFFQGNRDRTHE